MLSLGIFCDNMAAATPPAPYLVLGAPNSVLLASAFYTGLFFCTGLGFLFLV